MVLCHCPMGPPAACQRVKSPGYPMISYIASFAHYPARPKSQVAWLLVILANISLKVVGAIFKM